MKRLFDVVLAFVGLVALSWLLLPVMFLVWLQDRHSPFYIAPRVARGGGAFRMVKLRSMIMNADKQGASSTANTDRRITPVGHFIRRYKLDEVMQLWNVLIGDMSLVGPRPQVQVGVDLYTPRERQLLDVRPGITDFASIVFADEGEILHGSKDPDGDYDRLIRPWKSRLGLVYVARKSLWLDIRLIALTVVAIISRKRALCGIEKLLSQCRAPVELVALAGRRAPLVEADPPEEEFLIPN